MRHDDAISSLRGRIPNSLRDACAGLGSGHSGSKQACRLGNHALHDDSRRGKVIGKVDSLTGDHRGNVEVAGLAGRGVPRCLLLDVLQQADLAPEPAFSVGVRKTRPDNGAGQTLRREMSNTMLRTV